ncbi:hypothetical protein I5G63_gp082 [Mycobacterium phage Imvubu]|uniref:Uncharacterized protein n=1 Tax=Mycobacterium phage Imvubu TaxID=2686233 RepID=A0A6B9L7P0_9CAUD|nr:hypothetical protein I5G63_gp082 [Mycobacterium phage Imvubu]QHB37822.1 hypothetical protein PBI_IMVUBU_82 [Mycobacterium phage Imvubu]
MSTVEVVLFGGPLDGERREVPDTLSAITIAQYAAPPDIWDDVTGDREVPILKHRYVKSRTWFGRFTYDGTVE